MLIRVHYLYKLKKLVEKNDEKTKLINKISHKIHINVIIVFYDYYMVLLGSIGLELLI